MQEIILFFKQNNGTRKLIFSVVALIFTMLILKLVNQFLGKKITNPNKFYMARKRSYYVGSISYIIIMIFVWLEMAGSFSTYIGLLSAGIAIALKDIFSNLAAWVFIILRKPFSVGDRIIIHGQRGDVIDIRIFQFSLIELNAPEDGGQSTGRIVEIPNNFVFIHPVINFVKGFNYIWNEIKVEITFESDWELAKQEFTKILEKNTSEFIEGAQKEIQHASRRYMFYYTKFTPIVYTDVRESGVLLTLRYLCEVKTRRMTVNNIWEDILRLVKQEERIDLAYPTKRIVF